VIGDAASSLAREHGVRAAPTPWLSDFAANYRDLLRFLRRKTGSEDTARELAHDAWIRIADHHGGRDGPGVDDPKLPQAASSPKDRDHARAYLFVVAERLAIDHLRRQRHWHEELLPRLGVVAPQAEAARTGGTHPHAPDVAESHAYAMALRTVDQALAAMPQRTREIFVSHRIDGVAHDELARRYGVSRKTIEREVSQAMDVAESALNGPRRRPGRRQALAALLGLSGLAVSGSAAWQAWNRWVPQWQAALASVRGRIETHRLPDGSRITLDAGSRARLEYFGSRRVVHLLEGRAFFAVAPDAARPFVVEAGAARVTVLGTRFAVERGGDAVEVGVESGRVRVEATVGAAVLELEPGQRARVDAATGARRLAGHGNVPVAPWRTGWLSFDGRPLAEVARELNRYRPDAPLQVAASISELPVVARVELARSAAWVQALPAVLPVRVTRHSDGWRVEPR
jgi:RNA polymerase sigma factor (sigma-70 family)